jgi:hypothetical protein
MFYFYPIRIQSCVGSPDKIINGINLVFVVYFLQFVEEVGSNIGQVSKGIDI